MTPGAGPLPLAPGDNADRPRRPRAAVATTSMSSNASRSASSSQPPATVSTASSASSAPNPWSTWSTAPSRSPRRWSAVAAAACSTTRRCVGSVASAASRTRSWTNESGSSASSPAPTGACSWSDSSAAGVDVNCSSSTMSMCVPGGRPRQARRAARGKGEEGIGNPVAAGRRRPARGEQGEQRVASARRVIAGTSAWPSPRRRSNSPTASSGRRPTGSRRPASREISVGTGRRQVANSRSPDGRRQQALDEGRRGRPGPLHVVEDHDPAVTDELEHGDEGIQRRVATCVRCALLRIRRQPSGDGRSSPAARDTRSGPSVASTPTGISPTASSSAAHHVTKPSRSDEEKLIHNGVVAPHRGVCQVRLADPGLTDQHDERRACRRRQGTTDRDDVVVTADRRVRRPRRLAAGGAA